MIDPTQRSVVKQVEVALMRLFHHLEDHIMRMDGSYSTNRDVIPVPSHAIIDS